ncbi:MAG: hypothetical protein FK734_13970 [Asgard group archaeon]|nr:hypothetical protein [Asgard group archaeon]
MATSASDLGKKTIVNLFFGMFIQAMIALAFDGGGIISGTIAKFLMDTEHIKWIVLVYGPLLAARGDIAVLAGKLGTGLHLGTVKPTFRKNTPIYRSLVASVLTIAMLDAVLVGAITYVMNLITFNDAIKVTNPLPFIVIPIIVMSIAALISVQITSAVSFFVYKRGLNPDIFVIPVMSTVNNVLITVIYALTLMILSPWGSTLIDIPGVGEVYPVATSSDLIASYIAIIPAALFLAGSIYIIIKNVKEDAYRKMMKEAVPAVFASAFIGTITGVTLSKGEIALEKYPQLLIAFPALIGTLVDQVAITANILITDFSAGYTEASLKSIKKPKVWTTFLGLVAGGLVVSIVLAVIGTFITWNTVETKWYIVLVIIVVCLANALGYVLIGSLIFVLSIVAFRREIDPDNFAIPLSACLADLACAGFIIVFSFLILPGVSVSSTETLISTVISFIG